MPRQYFSIKKEIFDIDFTSKSKAFDLQNRISSIVNGSLTKQMEVLLEERIPKEFLYKFNTLTVDVGIISFGNLEEELPEKFMEAFTAALDEQIGRLKSGINDTDFQILPADHSLEELMDFFLFTGHLPWWAMKNDSLTPSFVLNELLMNNPSALRVIILRAGQYEHVRKRLARQFNRNQLQGIIRVLEPAEAEYIFGFEEQLLKINPTEKFIQIEEKEFEKAVAYFILTYLIVERGGAFNRKMFAKSILEQIAFGFNIKYEQLLHIFYSAIVNLENSGLSYTTPLKVLIRELAFEEDANHGWKINQEDTIPRTIPADESIRDLNILRQYLVYGTLPFSVAGNDGDADSLRSRLFRVIANMPETFQLMLSQISWNRKVADRLFELLGSAQAKQYIKNLYKGRADIFINIGDTFSLLHKTKQTWVVSEKVFEEAIWRSILSATILSPINLIDDRQLVHLILKGISSTLRVSIQVVTQRIHTGIKSIFNIDHMQMRHLDLINEVLNGIQDGKEVSLLMNQTEVNKDIEITEVLFSTEAQMLSHVLRFLLQYGSLPWWGRQYAGKSPGMLFQQLYEKSIVEAQLIFRFAGTSSQLRHRWLSILGEQSFFTIIKSFDAGQNAIQALRLQKELFEVIPDVLKGGKAKPVKMDLVMVNLLWQVLHVGGYQYFSLPGFYIKIFSAIVDLLNIRPSLLLSEWKMRFQFVDQTTEPAKLVIDALMKLYNEVEKQKSETMTLSTDVISGLWAQIFREIGFVIDKQVDFTEARSLTDLIQETDTLMKGKVSMYLLGILQSYLIDGTLPSSLETAGISEKEYFFRQLLQIIYVNHPLQLIKVLSLSEANSFRVLEVTSMYKITEGGSSKDIALLMLPIRNKLKSVVRLKSIEEIKIFGKKEQEIFVNDMLIAFTSENPTQSSSDRSKDIYNIIRYYLIWNRLPDVLQKNITISSDIIIRHMIRHLFLLDQKLVIKLLAEKNIPPSSLMSIYAIIAAGNTPDDKKLLRIMQESKLLKQEREVMTDFSSSLDIQEHFYSNPSTDELIDKKELEHLIFSGSVKDHLKNRNDWVSFLARSEEKLYQTVLSDYRNEMHGSFEKDSNYIETLIATVFTDTLLRERILTLVRYFNLRSAVQGLIFRGTNEYFSLLFRYLSQSIPNSLSVLERILEKETEQSEQSNIQLQNFLVQEITILKEVATAGQAFNKFYEERDNSITSRDRLREQQKITESFERELQDAKEKQRLEEAELAKAKQQDKNVKLFIPNAGLVILHPFFSTYFTRLALMENSVFLNDYSKERAVLLLQYLATGRSKFEEYELILNKILCGLPIEQSVAFEIELKENEIALTNELFDVLKQRWDKVKNSSIESIRASFIQREGALELIEDQWNLRVEQRGYDLLLQTMPWAFGFIKTSWMNQILTVEWI